MAAGDPVRLLRGPVAGQSHQDRADPAEPRADPRSQRPAARDQCAVLPAGADARAGRRHRRDADRPGAARAARQRRLPEPEEGHSQPAHLRGRAGEAAAHGRGARAVRRAPLPVPRRRDPAAPDALLPARRQQRARNRLRRRDQRGRREGARSQRVRRHDAHRQERRRESLRTRAARPRGRPATAGQRARPQRRAHRQRRGQARSARAGRGQRPVPDDRPARAANRGGSAARPARGGGRDRSDEWRRHRVRQHAGLRSESVRARPDAPAVPGADGGPRPPDVRPRAARRLSAGLDGEAAVRARRARSRRRHGARHALLPRHVVLTRLRPCAPRLETWRPRHCRHAPCARHVVRHLLLRRRAHDGHRPHGGVDVAIRPRRADRHRHRGRARRHPAVDRSGRSAPTRARSSRSGSQATPSASASARARCS